MVFKNRRAITFLEIVIAVAILAVAMIPMFGLMSRGTVESDRNASQAFAINKATEVLNTLLDNVPFVAIRQGNPGYIKVDDISKLDRYSSYTDAWAQRMIGLMFPGTTREGAGWVCRGVVPDARGIHYLVHLKVEDVASVQRAQRPETQKIGSAFPDSAPVNFNQVDEVTFSFLRNPSMLSDGNWLVDYATDVSESGKPLTEAELSPNGIAEAPGNIYLDQSGDGSPIGPDGFVDPTAARYTARMVTNKMPYQAPDDQAHVPMKKLLVQVQWNLDQRYFATPETSEGQVQRIHLMTIKGDID